MSAETIAGLLLARQHEQSSGIMTEEARWSWAEVVTECAAVAAVFADLGVAGKHIGVLLENTPDYVFALGAAALTGSVIVGINPTRRGEELARDIAHTECALILTDTSQRHLLDGVDVHAPIVLVDGDEWRRRVTAQRGAEAPRTEHDPSTLYLLIFTSGSTGAPKAVKMSQGRAARTVSAAAVAYSPQDVLYCSMPLFHGNALLANLFPAIKSGATVVLKRKFSASAFMPDIRHFGVTSFNYVGRALSYVLAQPEDPDDLNNKLTFCIGSEASPRDRKEFRRRFGCYVAEGYSSSEGGITIQPFAGMPKEALGRPPEDADVVILDPETDQECPPAAFDDNRQLLNATEAIGEIVRRDGLSNFEGYWANDEANADRGRNGWYWSGDLGYRDHEGTFYFAGRTSDWLRVDGENFAAGPIERIIGRFEGVASTVAYGVPDPNTGDQVMVALELDATASFDPDTFGAFLRAQPDLGTKWAPRFVRVVDAIPLTATGKVDRKPLRAEGWTSGSGLWWRHGADLEYEEFTPKDREALEAEFERAGRSGVLGLH